MNCLVVDNDPVVDSEVFTFKKNRIQDYTYESINLQPFLKVINFLRTSENLYRC